MIIKIIRLHSLELGEQVLLDHSAAPNYPKSRECWPQVRPVALGSFPGHSTSYLSSLVTRAPPHGQPL